MSRAPASPYPHYDVLAKWHSPSFDEATRAVLRRRLHELPPRRFLNEAEWHLLEAVCARLLPQPERSAPIPIVPWIDEMLYCGRGEGFRHDGMPVQGEIWRIGLAALDGEARRRYDVGFAALAPERQDATLAAIATGDVDAARWHPLPAQRFFTDFLLKTCAGVYYAHPAAWNEIGFGGPASPRGYVRLGFDQRDAWEAREET